jgi:hypothetical protein
MVCFVHPRKKILTLQPLQALWGLQHDGDQPQPHAAVPRQTTKLTAHERRATQRPTNQQHTASSRGLHCTPWPLSKQAGGRHPQAAACRPHAYTTCKALFSYHQHSQHLGQVLSLLAMPNQQQNTQNRWASNDCPTPEKCLCHTSTRHTKFCLAAGLKRPLQKHSKQVLPTVTSWQASTVD